jgi:hypothetical protein
VQFGPQIIDAEEQHVGLLLRSGRHCQDKQSHRSHHHTCHRTPGFCGAQDLTASNGLLIASGN